MTGSFCVSCCLCVAMVSVSGYIACGPSAVKTDTPSMYLATEFFINRQSRDTLVEWLWGFLPECDTLHTLTEQLLMNFYE